MNPQPPVTRMRMAARTSSGSGGALADFPMLRDQLEGWKTRLAATDWIPSLIIGLGALLRFWLTFKFGPFAGRSVSRMAALAMAVSPGFVFYGRYSIHEVWLVLFSMLFVLGLLGLWKFGTPNYLWCAGMGLAGMILTKETYIIHLGCALMAVPVLFVANALSR